MENKQKITTPEHVVYFDYLRIAAIIAIVFLHSSSQNWYTTDITSPYWQAFNVFDSLTRWGVPIFIMISGALFLNKEQPLKKIYRKNIIRILLLIFVWTLIYALWQFFANNSSLSEEFIISSIIGPNYLWFLYMLIGLYIITPLLRKIVIHKKLLNYFLLLSLFFAFLIPQLIAIINLKFGTIGTILEDKVEKTNFFFTLGYSGYFALGYYLNKYPIKKNTKIAIYLTGAMSAILTIILTSRLSNLTGKANPLFYNFLTINVAATSIAIFVFFKNHIKSKLSTFQKRKTIQLLSRCSLGVYLIHIIVLESLDKIFGLNSFSFNPILAVPLLSLLVLLISYPISIVLYKIPIIGNRIV